MRAMNIGPLLRVVAARSFHDDFALPDCGL